MPKLTAEDLEKIIHLTGAEDSSGLRMALANVLLDLWDQGYSDGFKDATSMHEAMTKAAEKPNPCPFDFAHTRHWCGYDGCRES